MQPPPTSNLKGQSALDMVSEKTIGEQIKEKDEEIAQLEKLHIAKQKEELSVLKQQLAKVEAEQKKRECEEREREWRRSKPIGCSCYPPSYDGPRLAVICSYHSERGEMQRWLEDRIKLLDSKSQKYQII